MNIAQHLERAARHFPDKPAILFEGQSVTHAELQREVDATETSPFASYNHSWHHRPGSVGTPIENVEMTILDADDQPVAIPAWGEICIKGPNSVARRGGVRHVTAEECNG
jgi:acyl-CoA synthetase (AMP-forming)/AMP-acid ligase II